MEPEQLYTMDMTLVSLVGVVYCVAVEATAQPPVTEEQRAARNERIATLRGLADQCVKQLRHCLPVSKPGEPSEPSGPSQAEWDAIVRERDALRSALEKERATAEKWRCECAALHRDYLPLVFPVPTENPLQKECDALRAQLNEERLQHAIALADAEGAISHNAKAINAMYHAKFHHCRSYTFGCNDPKLSTVMLGQGMAVLRGPTKHLETAEEPIEEPSEDPTEEPTEEEPTAEAWAELTRSQQACETMQQELAQARENERKWREAYEKASERASRLEQRQSYRLADLQVEYTVPEPRHPKPTELIYRITWTPGRTASITLDDEVTYYVYFITGRDRHAGEWHVVCCAERSFTAFLRHGTHGDWDAVCGIGPITGRLEASRVARAVVWGVRGREATLERACHVMSQFSAGTLRKCPCYSSTYDLTRGFTVETWLL